MKLKSILFFGVFCFSSTVNAQQQRPVTHAHNGKTHTHVLPNNGVGKHNHQGNHNTKNAYYNKAVAHMHGDKRHTHVLPNGQKNHNHSKPKAKSVAPKSQAKPSKPKASSNQVKTLSNGVRIANKTYSKGQRYNGEVNAKGKRHGKGTFYWPSGQKYVGEWKDDEQSGQGTMSWADGNKYVGEWKDGKRSGQGTFYWSNKDKFIGTYKNGKAEGLGKRYSANGSVDIDTYVSGKPKGKEIKHLINFAKSNGFGDLVSSDGKSVSATWANKDAKSDSIYYGGVQGEGKITLSLSKGAAHVTGMFKDGVLVGDGKLRVYSSKCYKSGFIFCKISEDGEKTRSITTSSSLSKLANDDLSQVRDEMYTRASKRMSASSNSSTTSSSSKDMNCYKINNDSSAIQACLGNAYATDSNDARQIILGNCYSLSDSANKKGLTQVCVNGKNGCYSLKDSDDTYACTTCNGSNQWLRTYAVGYKMTCY